MNTQQAGQNEASEVTMNSPKSVSSRSPRSGFSVVEPLPIAIPNAKEQMSESQDSEDTIIIHVEENLYAMVLLLYSREAQESSLYSLIHPLSLRKIKFLAAASFVVQMCGILYFLTNWSDWISIVQGPQFLHDCTIPAEDWQYHDHRIPFDAAQGSAIPNQKCQVLSFTHAGYQSFDAQNVIGKFISVFMLFAFITPDMLSIPRFITLSKIAARGWFRAFWITLSVFQCCLMLTAIIRIATLIYNQDGVIEIFTVGISFIILVELDDKIYGAVKALNVFGEDLFCIKLKRSETIQKYSLLYTEISVDSHDCIVLIGMAITGLLSTTIYVCVPYIFGYLGVVQHTVTAVISFVCLFVPMVIMPVAPHLFYRCLKRK
mmetsp:Transcript_17370/g.27706  ORF Transcript_17370/g.27706 Transcript_17370/m.27706 type:complete len:375 (-) Transcript_17370:97-1221(-)